MTEPEKFLTRWSRRKRQGADDDVDMSATPSMSETSAPPNESAPVAEKDSGEPGVDLASLPPIESITAQTDIRAFLAPGVPRELAAAALRRAWSVDPAIRDFVGLADYAWDFHAPGSMPGFGPLEMTDDLRQVVARILGDSPAETDAARSRNAVPSDQSEPDQSASDQSASDRSVILSMRAVPDQALAPSVELPSDKVVAENDSLRESDNVSHSMVEIDVAQRKADGFEVIKTVTRRTHGRALPQ
jgi:hypothetical protein